MVPPGGIRRGRPPMRGSPARRQPDAPAPPVSALPGPGPGPGTGSVGNSRPDAAARTAAPPPTAEQRAKKRVLFVCIGNSCRSQMAEAFARAYGSDVMEVQSAGLSPASIIAPLTRKMLDDRHVDAEEQFPKGLDHMEGQQFDIVVNLSGYPLPVPAARTDTWPVPDPIGQPESVYRDCAARIETLVMKLIMELRSA